MHACRTSPFPKGGKDIISREVSIPEYDGLSGNAKLMLNWVLVSNYTQSDTILLYKIIANKFDSIIMSMVSCVYMRIYICIKYED